MNPYYEIKENNQRIMKKYNNSEDFYNQIQL
jgi:hypothetical protein